MAPHTYGVLSRGRGNVRISVNQGSTKLVGIAKLDGKDPRRVLAEPSVVRNSSNASPTFSFSSQTEGFFCARAIYTVEKTPYVTTRASVLTNMHRHSSDTACPDGPLAYKRRRGTWCSKEMTARSLRRPFGSPSLLASIMGDVEETAPATECLEHDRFCKEWRPKQPARTMSRTHVNRWRNRRSLLFHRPAG